MGASESLWAIMGNPSTEDGVSIPQSFTAAVAEHGGLLPGFEDLVYLDAFKIEEKSSLKGAYKVLNAACKKIYRTEAVTSSHFNSNVYKEIFRVSDSQKREVIQVFQCCNGEISNTKSLPGVLIGFVKITIDILNQPEFQILDESGEAILDVTPAKNNSYQVFLHGESSRVGKFRPRVFSLGIKGNIQRDLDVRMKAGVMLLALVVCRKRTKPQERDDAFNAITTKTFDGE